ncbi:MAG: ATP-grasp domain-containing protein [Deltaproteobacteria bacterium]|nr:ATP-grasp domain-containing protein [Deltaproteobacteria bacterium]
MIPKNIFITYNDDAYVRKGELDDIISLQGVVDTADSVKKAIEENGIAPKLVPLKDDPEDFIKMLRHGAPDIIFNLCEGAFGLSSMEMNVAGLYELFGFRYTGSGPLTLGLSLNKETAKNILYARGIPTPKYAVIGDIKSLSSVSISFPLIVKPVHEDAGIGIDNNAVVWDITSLKKRIEYIIDIYKQPALVEEYIDGREFNVSVIGNETPNVLPVSEIDFSELPMDIPKIVGYEAKWITTSPLYKKTVPVCPANISKDIEEKLSCTAIKAYKALGCRDYARIDIRMGNDNMPKVLEVNPNPDISPDAGLARSALAAGFSYSKLICEIINCAVKRYDGTDKKFFKP